MRYVQKRVIQDWRDASPRYKKRTAEYVLANMVDTNTAFKMVGYEPSSGHDYSGRIEQLEQRLEMLTELVFILIGLIPRERQIEILRLRGWEEITNDLAQIQKDADPGPPIQKRTKK